MPIVNAQISLVPRPPGQLVYALPILSPARQLPRAQLSDHQEMDYTPAFPSELRRSLNVRMYCQSFHESLMC